MQFQAPHRAHGSTDAGFLDPIHIIGDIGLREGMHFSEFGAGAGHFSILASRLVGSRGHVSAIDVREESLDTVRIKAKAERLDNIQTIHANLEVGGSSGLEDGSQDVVMLANMLFQSNKKREIIVEAHRVLKPGGVLAVIDWVKGGGGFGPPDHYRIDDVAMKALVGEAGFVFQRPLQAGSFHYGLLFLKK